MKSLVISLLLVLFSSYLFAQPANDSFIETDLSHSYDKINYWSNIENQKSNAAMDSLKNANTVFAAKLKSYTARYPFTITMQFKKLSDDLKITTSADHLFRIYSWDTGMGGTMHNNGYVMQYKTGTTTKSVLNVGSLDNFELNYYFDLFTVAANGHLYYLPVSSQSMGGQQYGEMVTVYMIEDGTLKPEKLIKTASGLHSSLYYTYSAIGNEGDDNPPNQDIEYNSKTQTISLPVVTAKGKVTTNRIIYQLVGPYFNG